MKHPTTRHAPDVTDDRGQLDVGIFERFVPPIDHRGMLIDELGTVSGHITPLAHVRRRHNARAQQPVLQQLRYHSPSLTSVLRPGTS